jgi:polysaccharide biosynthesis transport protein
MFDFASPLHGEPVRMVVAEPAAPTASAFDVSAIGRRLWRGSGFIVLSGLFMVAAAIAVLGTLTPAYVSGIQILIDPTDLRSVDNDVTVRSPQSDAGVSLAESQAKVIQSDSVLRRVITKLSLDKDSEFTKPDSNNAVTVFLKNALGLAPPAASRDPVIMALDTLRTKTTVRRPERTFVIDVQVKSQDPQKAADIAKAIGDAYFAEEANARTEAAKRVSDSLTARLNTLRDSLEEAEGKVVRYREANKLSTSTGRAFSDQQLGDLNQQLVTASVRTAEARSRLDQAKTMTSGEAGTALPEMIQSLEMQSLRQQYATLSRNIAELATRLGSRHPAMAELEAQQRDLQRLIQVEKTRIIESTRKDYDRAAASEAAIRKTIDQVKTDLSKTDRAAVGLRELERTADSRRGVYEAFLKRSREVGEQERLNNTNVRIISSATPARLRAWPPSPRIALPAALVLGLLLGAAIALALGADRDRKRARKVRRPLAQPRSLRAADA